MSAVANINWDIKSQGRSWDGDKGEAMARFTLKPHKIEMVDGKLLGNIEDREILLCMLLENVGADRVVQFGDPAVWRSAVAKLER
jgi:hypothetical protein